MLSSQRRRAVKEWVETQLPALVVSSKTETAPLIAYVMALAEKGLARSQLSSTLTEFFKENTEHFVSGLLTEVARSDEESSSKTAIVSNGLKQSDHASVEEDEDGALEASAAEKEQYSKKRKNTDETPLSDSEKRSRRGSSRDRGHRRSRSPRSRDHRHRERDSRRRSSYSRGTRFYDTGDSLDAYDPERPGMLHTPLVPQESLDAYGQVIMRPQQFQRYPQAYPNLSRPHGYVRSGYAKEVDDAESNVPETATSPTQHKNGRGGKGASRGGQSRDYLARKNDPDLSTVLLTSVPKEQNNILTLSQYFKFYGDIVNVQLKPDEGRAYIQFTTHEAALKAISSTKAVLGNRFIKTLWAKFNPKSKDDILDESKSEEETRKIKESVESRVQQEKREKKISSIQEKILARETLLVKLSAMKGESDERQKMISSLRNEIEQFNTVLEKLQSGEIPDDFENLDSQGRNEQEVPSTRGRGGRGRGIVRGRGRGRGAFSATHRGPMNLDNRSKTLLVRNIPEEFNKEQLLKSHFQNFGSIVSVATHPDGPGTAVVEFDLRKNAQTAISKGKLLLGNSLELSFHEEAISTNDTGVLDIEDSGNVIAANDVGNADDHDHYGSDEEEDNSRSDRSWRR